MASTTTANAIPAGMVSRRASSLLNRAKAQGKKIFVVEYLSGGCRRQRRAEIRKQGFVPNFAGRDLGN